VAKPLEAAFADPSGKNRDSVRELSEAILKLVLDHLQNAKERPLLPPTPPQVWTEIPEEPANQEQLLAELKNLLAGAMNPHHPGYIGHMDPPPTTASFLGELAAAAVNNNLLSYEMAPSFTRLEVQLLRSFARLFGFGDRAGGVMQSGGTLANLLALTVARNLRLEVHDQGLFGLKARPVILASEDAHASIKKAAMLLGLGAEGALPVASDARGRMSPDALTKTLENARETGLFPFAVVATAGTTVTGSIDPLAEIAAVSKQERLWLHVDAAYAGALAFTRHSDRLLGIEEADSITFNPQKWLYVAKTNAMVLFRDERALDQAFRVPAPYMQERGERNLGELGVQGSRHAEVLKLWLSLLQLGKRGYRALIEDSLNRAKRFAEQVKARPFLKLFSEPETSIVVFRGPREDWTQALQAHLIEKGLAFFSLPLYRNTRWLRAVLLNSHTDESTLNAIFAAIDAFAERTLDGDELELD